MSAEDEGEFEPVHRTAREQVQVVRSYFSDEAREHKPGESWEVGVMAGMLIRFDEALRHICRLDPMGSERAEQMRQIAWGAVKLPEKPNV